eukprot:SAG11_NODE_38191_length_253_cov_1.006494_1_plen_42_part_10
MTGKPLAQLGCTPDGSASSLSINTLAGFVPARPVGAKALTLA